MRGRKIASHGLALIALLGLAAVAASCASFAPLASNVCGNSVVDESEDCDSHVQDPSTHCGAADTLNACRFLCAPKSTTEVCPSGWGCGRDGVCRIAKDHFEPLHDLVPFASPHDLRVADFNGDGTLDVLLLGVEDARGLTPARIVFSATPSTPRRVQVIPTTLAAPVVADLDGEGASELGFTDLNGISIYQARAQDRAAFAPFPTFLPPSGTSLRALPMDVIPTDPGDEIVMFVERNKMGATLEGPPEKVSSSLLKLAPLGKADLAGPIAWGRLDEGAPCPQIVLPFRGIEAVRLFTPCRAKDGQIEWNQDGTSRAIQLPLGAKVDRGVLLVDLDLDQHLDLLIGASGHTYVAWGVGDGTFRSTKSNGAIDTAGLYALPEEAGGDTAFPLAAADLNGDGAIDFVVPKGIVVSVPGQYKVTQNNTGSWSQAVIADFNGDQRLDVAVGSSSAINIDLFTNAGGGVFNYANVPTDGPTSQFVAGDFDGDLVTDLAFAQRLKQASSTEDDLTIAFGATFGSLSAPVITAELSQVEQLSPAHIDSTTSADGIVDLVAVSQYVTGSTDAMFTFEGAGSRSLQAPLPLGDLGKPDVAVALAAGRFGNDLPDLIAVGADSATGALRLWRIDENADLVLAHLHPSEALASEFHSNAPNQEVSFSYGVTLAAGNLDRDMNDKLDEVVLAAPYGPDGGAALVIADYDAKTFHLTPRKEQPFAAVISVDSTLRLLDVDGDDNLDAVLTTGTDEAPSDLLVFWGNGARGLDTAAPARIQVEGGINDVACLPRSRGKGCQLIAVTTKDALEIMGQPGRTFTVTKRTDLVGGHGIGVGDFDNDGVVDVAIQTSIGLQIYRSVPVHE